MSPSRTATSISSCGIPRSLGCGGPVRVAKRPDRPDPLVGLLDPHMPPAVRRLEGPAELVDTGGARLLDAVDEGGHDLRPDHRRLHVLLGDVDEAITGRRPF